MIVLSPFQSSPQSAKPVSIPQSVSPKEEKVIFLLCHGLLSLHLVSAPFICDPDLDFNMM